MHEHRETTVRQLVRDYGQLVPKTTHTKHNSYPRQLVPRTNPPQGLVDQIIEKEKALHMVLSHMVLSTKTRGFKIPLSVRFDNFQICIDCISNCDCN